MSYETESWLFAISVVLPIAAAVIGWAWYSVRREQKWNQWREDHDLPTKVNCWQASSQTRNFERVLTVAQERIKATMSREAQRDMKFLSNTEIADLGYELAKLMEAAGCTLIIEDSIENDSAKLGLVR